MSTVFSLMLGCKMQRYTLYRELSKFFLHLLLIPPFLATSNGSAMTREMATMSSFFVTPITDAASA